MGTVSQVAKKAAPIVVDFILSALLTYAGFYAYQTLSDPNFWAKWQGFRKVNFEKFAVCLMFNLYFDSRQKIFGENLAANWMAMSYGLRHYLVFYVHKHRFIQIFDAIL
jgi:hypothetical protein